MSSCCWRSTFVHRFIFPTSLEQCRSVRPVTSHSARSCHRCSIQGPVQVRCIAIRCYVWHCARATNLTLSSKCQDCDSVGTVNAPLASLHLWSALVGLRVSPGALAVHRGTRRVIYAISRAQRLPVVRTSFPTPTCGPSTPSAPRPCSLFRIPRLVSVPRPSVPKTASTRSGLMLVSEQYFL